MIISYYNGVDPVVVGNIKLLGVLKAISEGKWQKEVEHLRTLSDGEYGEQKEKLLSVTFSGTFSHRNAEKLIDYTNMIVLDIDKLTSAQITAYTQDFRNDQFIFAFFISPSNKGIKILIRVNNKPEEHQKAFLALEDYFASRYAATLDKSGKDVSRLCFVSYDPDLYYNPDSQVFDVVSSTVVESKKNHAAREQGFVGKKVTSNVQYIFDVCKQWVERKYNFVDGQRNFYIFNLACTLNRCGVVQGDALFLIDQNFVTPNNKWHQSVNSAYHHNRREHNTINVYDLGGSEFVDSGEEKEYSEDMVINEILTNAVELFRRGVATPVIRTVVYGYAKWYMQTGAVKLNDADLRNILNEAYTKYSTPSSSGSEMEWQMAGNMSSDVMAEILLTKITTVMSEFDSAMGGGPIPGNFYGLIGRGMTFKSIILLWWCVANARKGIPCLYLNGEMSKRQFWERMVENVLGVHSSSLSNDAMAELINKINEILGNNLFVVTGTGFSEEGIINTCDDIEKVTNKKIQFIAIDGIKQMFDAKKDELKSAIYNSVLCKEIAKQTNTAVIALYHLSGNSPLHMRNTVDNVRGGQNTATNMDGWFGTSLIVDKEATNGLTGDEIVHVPDKVYLRYQDKRITGQQVNKVIQVNRPMSLEPLELDPNSFEVKLKTK